MFMLSKMIFRISNHISASNLHQAGFSYKYLVIIYSAEEVIILHISILGFLACLSAGLQKKLLNGFPQNFDGGWISVQNRPH